MLPRSGAHCQGIRSHEEERICSTEHNSECANVTEWTASWLDKGVNSTLFQTGVPVFLCLSSGERTVLERKEEYHAAQGRMRFIIMPFSVFIVNYVKVWHIHLHKCALCDRFHFVEFWYGRGPARKYVFFRASCLDKKCQLRFDKVCHGIMSSCYDKVCRQRRIARKVIDYIKNNPRYLSCIA